MGDGDVYDHSDYEEGASVDPFGIAQRMKEAMEGVPVAPSVRSVVEDAVRLVGIDPNAPKMISCTFVLKTTAEGHQLQRIAHAAARELQLQFRDALQGFIWSVVDGSGVGGIIPVGETLDRNDG